MLRIMTLRKPPFCRSAVSLLNPCFPKRYSPRTCTIKVLLRGPSNSQKKIPCQVPSTNWPSLITNCLLHPTSELLQCASELPSSCRYPARRWGTSSSSVKSISWTTERSAFSFIGNARRRMGTINYRIALFDAGFTHKRRDLARDINKLAPVFSCLYENLW